ncbi:MAG: DegT/DnrJ/EryC1/StrS family aminotransferase [Nitrospinae bacterium]|nr:DegT/DnrJ/EryC1/StrS family aminotransferase [Nitrospinota bacterium]
MIPLVDLKAQYAAIRREIDAALQGVLDSCAFIKGANVAAFEREFAGFCGASGCATTGNGTDALYLALRALGITAGDEVITVANTFIATAEAITLAGAKPVFVDTLEGSMLLDPSALESAITSKTKAIAPVHLYGQPCDMDSVMDIAGRHGLLMVEDAAQAHGALWSGKPAGTLGHAGCFSFFPGKNLGAYGDGGAVISGDQELIRKIGLLSNHGRSDKYLHQMEGVNSRLDELQAAVLRVKLRYLREWTDKRNRVARLYIEALTGSNVKLPEVDGRSEPAWHLFVIRVGNRDELRARLKEQGVDTGVHYPVPLHLQPAYERFGMPEGSLPVTERHARQILSLPIYPELSGGQVAHVAEIVRKYARPVEN